jgi:hypothetical protein
LQYRYSNPGTRRSWACGARVGIIVTVAASMLGWTDGANRARRLQAAVPL